MAKQYEEKMKAKYLPFRIGQVTERFAEQAKKELNETEEVKRRALTEFRKRVQTLDIHQPDDPFLVEFLRPRKYEVDRAYKLLMSFFEVRNEYSECFSNLDIEDLTSGISRTGIASFLPFRTSDGCAILLIELHKWDTSVYHLVDVIRLVGILAMCCLEDPATQVSGIKIIINAKGASLKIIKFFTPRYITLLSRALRNCLPVRFKGIHLVNESIVLQYVWSLLKIFLTEKIKKRIHFHADNMKGLQNYIPRELLTEEYGGSNKYFDQGQMCSKYLQDNKHRVPDVLMYGNKK